MKLSTLSLLSAALPSSLAWGGFGHVTIAYIASDFVSNQTAAFLQKLLYDQTPDYLASVATWADSVRYTKWGHFTGAFHYIDAKDDPPHSCSIDLKRDCKPEGCVVTALANYTTQLMDQELNWFLRRQAAKFVIHFVSDLHQPLHDEDVSRGGNGIHVLFDGVELNLHHVWDSSIPEKMVGGKPRKPYDAARLWAKELTREITDGKFKSVRDGWLADIDLEHTEDMALTWAREGNAYVCSHVLPEGPKAIAGKELGGEYYDKAVPVIETQVARAGYRLAAWLDIVVSRISKAETALGDEL